MPSNKNSFHLATISLSTLKFVGQTVLFFWGIFFSQIGMTGYQQGILMAIYPLVGLLSTLPLGLLNDRIYSKTLISIGYLLLAFQFLEIGETQNFFLIGLLLMLGSLGSNMIKVSTDSFFYKASDPKKSKQVGSYVGTHLLGAGLGVLAGGLLLGKISFESLFHVAAGLCLIMGVLSLFLPQTTVLHLEWKEYRKDLFKPEILIFMSMIFLWGIHMGSEITSYGLFLKENLNLNFTEMGLYMGLTISAMFFWVKGANHLIHNRFPILRILYGGLFLSGIGQAIMLYPHLGISFAGRFLHEGGDALMFFFLYYGVRKLFAQEKSGGSSGLLSFVQLSANILSVLLLAPLGKQYGNAYPLLIGAIFSLLALPLAMRFSHLIKH